MKKYTIKGKCSTFGGPKDTKGVTADEDLALHETVDGAPVGLFLKTQPEGTTGTARRLDPQAHYIAMRWAYSKTQAGKEMEFGKRLDIVTSRAWLRNNRVRVSANGQAYLVLPVDFGPNGRTDRVADLSPGLAAALGVKTDDEVTVEIEV